MNDDDARRDLARGLEHHFKSYPVKNNRVLNTIWVISRTLTPRTRFTLVAAAALLISFGIYVDRVTPLVAVAAALLVFAVFAVKDETKFAREVVRRRLPQWVFRRMLRTQNQRPWKKYVSVVAKHPLVSSETIRYAWNNDKQSFNQNMIGHDNTPLDVLQAAWPEAIRERNDLRQRNGPTIRTILLHPNLDRDTFQSFLKECIAENDLRLLAHFMFSPLLTADDIRIVVTTITKDTDFANQSTALSVAARHPITPTDILDALALHPSAHVRKGVAGNPNTSPRARTLATITR